MAAQVKCDLCNRTFSGKREYNEHCKWDSAHREKVSALREVERQEAQRAREEKTTLDLWDHSHRPIVGDYETMAGIVEYLWQVHGMHRDSGKALAYRLYHANEALESSLTDLGRELNTAERRITDLRSALKYRGAQACYHSSEGFNLQDVITANAKAAERREQLDSLAYTFRLNCRGFYGPRQWRGLCIVREMVVSELPDGAWLVQWGEDESMVARTAPTQIAAYALALDWSQRVARAEEEKALAQ